MTPEVVARKARVTFDWADGTYTFALPIGQMVELQEACDAGPAWIKARLESETWKVQDVRDTIRLGLIGGGMIPANALKLVRRYVDGRPLLESVPVAHVIIGAALVGVADEPPKKSEGEGTESPSYLSPEEKSGSAPSTASEPQWDGAPPTSTEPASGSLKRPRRATRKRKAAR